TLKQSLIASTMESSAKCPPQLLEVRAEGRRWIGVRVRKEQLDVGRRLRLRGCDACAQRVSSLCADRGGEVVVQDPCATEIALEAPDALALLLLFDPVEVDVRTRVVGRRVRRRAIRQRLNEGRPLAGTRARYGLARRLVA